MRDPATRMIEPVEAAIQETVRYLKRQDLRSDAARGAVLSSKIPDGMSSFRPGRSRPTNAGRDSTIAVAVLLLCAQGFRPTRNRDKHGQPGGESASAIVAVALHRLRLPATEAAVEKVWERHRRYYPPFKALRTVAIFSCDGSARRLVSYAKRDL